MQASLPSSKSLEVQRHYTAGGTLRDVFDRVTWVKRRAEIRSGDKVIFEMEDVEVPEFWSQLATDILASKYFRKAGLKGRGVCNDNKRDHESSLREVVYRIVHTIGGAGQALGYFDPDNRIRFEAELAHMIVHQIGAFNSPVWFNVGLWHEYSIKGNGDGNWAWQWGEGNESVAQTSNAYERPQGSACFILHAEDDLMHLFENIKTEVRLFKGGSGSGINFDAIRGRGESLSGGGTSSGLLSWLKVYDTAAGSIKSGGVTRRAATIRMLSMDHPDIEDFIGWKSSEEKKARALIAQGYSSDFNGEAYATVSGQNSNNSIRASDAFMQSIEVGGDWNTIARTTGKVWKTYQAKDLWRSVAQAAWECADPGVQFDDTINKWHMIPSAGRIASSNPCQPGFATVLTPRGIKTFDDIDVGSVIWSGQQWTTVTRKIATGTKPVKRYRTTAGSFVGTENHRVVQKGKKIEVKDAVAIDRTLGPLGSEGELSAQDVMDGWMIGDGSVHTASNNLVYLNVGANDGDVQKLGPLLKEERPGIGPFAWEVETSISANELPKTFERDVPARFERGSEAKLRGFLRGLYSANGSVVSNRVMLKAASRKVIDAVQRMLSSLGIPSYVTTNKAHDVEFSNGTYECKESYDLNITHGRNRFRDLIGFVHDYKTAKLNAACNQEVKRSWSKSTYDIGIVEDLGEMPVWDITVDAPEHTYWTGGMLVSNCSEHMAIDSSACNLSSLNLVKFDDVHGFQWGSFQHAARVFTLAMDILVDLSSYPTKEIAINAHKYRHLGLGYANLGALLMRCGMPYDSPEGRLLAAEITSRMTTAAWKTSAEISYVLGPVASDKADRPNMVNVLQMHHDAAKNMGLSPIAQHEWQVCMSVCATVGLRNAQTTLLAPTGTISLSMDCDTSGIEPDFSLVKFKKLAGGGFIKYANTSVGTALLRLGYSDDATKAILDYIQANDTYEGAPFLDVDDYPVFDCANRCGNGERYIKLMGHVEMMAAVQPFLDSAISKTCNAPNSITVEEIEKVYFDAWKMGLKSITIYRDGCKASQPLNSKSDTKADSTDEKAPASLLPGQDGSTVVPASVALPAVTSKLARVSHRRQLPNRRHGFTQKARVGGHKVYVRTGEYPDGTLGEIFIDLHKEGATLRSMMNLFAMAVSLGLQHGVPLERFVEQFTFTRFEPQGSVECDPRVKFATSIPDYVFRMLAVEYLKRDDLAHVQPTSDDIDPEAQEVKAPQPDLTAIDPSPAVVDPNVYNAKMMGDAPPCSTCGNITIRNGTCYKCLCCGSSQGCS